MPEILTAATGNGAKILHQEGKVGCIAPGAFADLLLTKEDPCKDIAALKELQLVIADGKMVE